LTRLGFFHIVLPSTIDYRGAPGSAVHTGDIRYERWTIADREMSRAAQFLGVLPTRRARRTGTMRSPGSGEDIQATIDRHPAIRPTPAPVHQPRATPVRLQSSHGGLTAAVRVDSATSRNPDLGGPGRSEPTADHTWR
jgi:hypothetical protein